MALCKTTTNTLTPPYFIMYFFVCNKVYKKKPKIATVTQSFSGDRIGSILSILIFTERLMKYSDMMEMTSPQDVSFFYSTVSAGNHMRSLVDRTGILSRRKVTVAANLESWRVLPFSRPSSHIMPLNGGAHCTTCDVINLNVSRYS